MINALSADALPRRGTSPVVLMVSGGSDSTAMLVRAARGLLDLGDGMGLDPAALHVLHVNHCLRGAASDGDEGFVRDLASGFGVACTVRRVDMPALLRGGGNMEEVARERRYEAAWGLAGALAAEAGVPWESARIAVAHTADDRVETFLMRACTGAGAGGMAGMRRRRGVVVRPLLGETRADLRTYLREQGIGWREDATNAGDAALRSYIRHRAVPVFEGRNPSFSRTLGSALDVLADEDDLLDRMAARELAALRLPAPRGSCAVDARRLASCEPALARRALRHALADLLGERDARRARLESRHIEALRGLAAAGRGSATLPLGVDARIEGGALVVALPAGAGAGTTGMRTAAGAGSLGRRDCPPAPAVLPVPGRLAWGPAVLEAALLAVPDGSDPVAFARGRARELAFPPDGDLRVEGRDFVLADAGALGVGEAGGTLQVGGPRAGERMRPFGMAGSKLVFDVLADAKVPARLRPGVPVVRGRYTAGGGVQEQGCVWVGGIRLDARAAYGPTTRMLIELQLTCAATGCAGAVG